MNTKAFLWVFLVIGLALAYTSFDEYLSSEPANVVTGQQIGTAPYRGPGQQEGFSDYMRRLLEDYGNPFLRKFVCEGARKGIERRKGFTNWLRERHIDTRYPEFFNKVTARTADLQMFVDLYCKDKGSGGEPTYVPVPLPDLLKKYVPSLRFPAIGWGPEPVTAEQYATSRGGLAYPRGWHPVYGAGGPAITILELTAVTTSAWASLMLLAVPCSKAVSVAVADRAVVKSGLQELLRRVSAGSVKTAIEREALKPSLTGLFMIVNPDMINRWLTLSVNPSAFENAYQPGDPTKPCDTSSGEDWNAGFDIPSPHTCALADLYSAAMRATTVNHYPPTAAYQTVVATYLDLPDNLPPLIAPPEFAQDPSGNVFMNPAGNNDQSIHIYFSDLAACHAGVRFRFYYPCGTLTYDIKCPATIPNPGPSDIIITKTVTSPDGTVTTTHTGNSIPTGTVPTTGGNTPCTYNHNDNTCTGSNCPAGQTCQGGQNNCACQPCPADCRDNCNPPSCDDGNPNNEDACVARSGGTCPPGCIKKECEHSKRRVPTD